MKGKERKKKIIKEKQGRKKGKDHKRERKEEEERKAKEVAKKQRKDETKSSSTSTMLFLSCLSINDHDQIDLILFLTKLIEKKRSKKFTKNIDGSNRETSQYIGSLAHRTRSQTKSTSSVKVF